MIAKLTDKLPEGQQWTYEVKWDGYQALLLKDHNNVQLRSRNDNVAALVKPRKSGPTSMSASAA